MAEADVENGRASVFVSLWRAASELQIVAGVVTAAGSAGLEQLRAGTSKEPSAPPLAVTVGGMPSPSAFEVAVPDRPPDVSGWSLVAGRAGGPLPWARSVDGAEAESSERRLVLVGEAESTVVTGLRARVFGAVPPAAAVVVAYGPARGANDFDDVVDASIVLDRPDAPALALGPGGAPGWPLFVDHALSLLRGEPQTFDVSMFGCDCLFELTVVSGGRESTIVVHDNDGQPFRLPRTPDQLPAWESGACANGSPGLIEKAEACISLPAGAGP